MIMTHGRTFKIKQIVIIIVNAILVLDVAFTAISGMVNGAGGGQVGDHVVGLGYLKPYTMDSNLLMFFAAVLMIAFCIKNLSYGEDVTPRWVVTFYFMGSACLFLTMFIAAAFLGPMKVLQGENYFVMFKDDMFFFHLVNPVISIFSFEFLIKKYSYRRRDCLMAIIPTVVYSLVYLVMVVLLKKWQDFYGFTFGGRYYLVPLVLIGIYALVWGLANLLCHLHNSSFPGKSVTAEKKAGNEGEAMVSDIIRGVLHRGDVLITGVEFNHEGKRTEIDELIINSGGVFIIEVKNYSGVLRGRKEDEKWLREKHFSGSNTETETIRNPIGQLKREIHILSQVIKAEGIKDVWVEGYVYFVQGNSPIRDEMILKNSRDIDRAIHGKKHGKMSPERKKQLTACIKSNRI